MLTPRVYLLSPEGRRLECLLLKDAAFYVLGCGASAQEAEEQILRLVPDLIVLDSVLPGQDALSILSRLGRRMPAPPRVLYLHRMRDEEWAQRAREKGADAILPWPAPDEVFLSAVHNAVVPLPRLAAPYNELRLSLAEAMLTDLKMPPSVKGRRYMAHAVAMAACSPLLLEALRDQLYPLLAERFGTTPAAVERAMRTAIESTWLRGDLNAIQRFFGFSVDAERGKPTNAEFIAMLTQHLRRRMAGRM